MSKSIYLSSLVVLLFATLTQTRLAVLAEPAVNASRSQTEEAVVADIGAALRNAGAVVKRDENGRIVEVSVGKRASDALLERIAGLPALRLLYVDTSERITARGLAAIGRMKGLKSLQVYSIRLTDDSLKHLSPLTQLERLSLQETGIGDEGLKHLVRLGNLRVLELGGNQITDAGLEHVAALDRLEELDLCNTSWSESRMQISDEGLAQLSRLRRLRRLNLSSTRIPLKVTAEGLRHLANFPDLESLRLSGDQITDRAMEHVAGCSKLKSLELLYTSVGDAGLAHIGKLQRLEAISLSSRHLTDQGLAHLAELPRLRHAELRTTGLTDRALESLSKIKSLERLDLYGSGEPGAHQGRGFTSAGLAHLVDLPNLKTLWLANMEADEGAVDVLKRFRQLDTLYAFFTSLSREELEALQTALPNTSVSASTGGYISLPPQLPRTPNSGRSPHSRRNR